MNLKGRSFTQKGLKDFGFFGSVNHQSWDGIYANHNAMRLPSFTRLRFYDRIREVS